MVTPPLSSWIWFSWQRHHNIFWQHNTPPRAESCCQLMLWSLRCQSTKINFAYPISYYMRQASNESRSLSSIAPCDSDQNKCHSLKISPHLKVVVLWNLAINPIVTSIKIMKKIKINTVLEYLRRSITMVVIICLQREYYKVLKFNVNKPSYFEISFKRCTPIRGAV